MGFFLSLPPPFLLALPLLLLKLDRKSDSRPFLKHNPHPNLNSSQSAVSSKMAYVPTYIHGQGMIISRAAGVPGRYSRLNQTWINTVSCSHAVLQENTSDSEGSHMLATQPYMWACKLVFKSVCGLTVSSVYRYNVSRTSEFAMMQQAFKFKPR